MADIETVRRNILEQVEAIRSLPSDEQSKAYDTLHGNRIAQIELVMKNGQSLWIVVGATHNQPWTKRLVYPIRCIHQDPSNSGNNRYLVKLVNGEEHHLIVWRTTIVSADYDAPMFQFAEAKFPKMVKKKTKGAKRAKKSPPSTKEPLKKPLF